MISPTDRSVSGACRIINGKTVEIPDAELAEIKRENAHR
jgi:hypothetical protein